MQQADETAIFDMDKAALDQYPDGVITIDRKGTITRFNRAEAELARRDQNSTLGLNFFNDVAPCTAVKEFKGVFDEFAKHHDNGVQKFNFTFRFAWGKQDVSIMLLRKAGVEDINVLVSRRSSVT